MLGKREEKRKKLMDSDPKDQVRDYYGDYYYGYGVNLST